MGGEAQQACMGLRALAASALSPSWARGRCGFPATGQLTEKSHSTEFIAMTAGQQSLYEEAVKSMRSQITGKAAAAAADKSEKGVSWGNFVDESVVGLGSALGRYPCPFEDSLLAGAVSPWGWLLPQLALSPCCACSVPAPPPQVEKFLRTLGAKKISHMFTHLRKIAQHPLLIRYHFSDDTVREIAAKAFQM